MNRTIAYRLEPVPEQSGGGLSTAAVITCMATGEILSGSGGGAEHLSPAVVDALRAGARPKVIMDEARYEALVSLARTAAEGFDVRKEAEALIASGQPETA